MSRVLLDTGPLVALLSERETHHSWVKAQFADWAAPCVTCEAVLSESFHLLAKVRGGSAASRSALCEGLIERDFDLRSELTTVLELMTRFQNVPMSLADACLVRMTEINPGARVFTFDSDFRIYRKNRYAGIGLITPEPP